MYSLDKVLLCTACEVAVNGWISATMARARFILSTAHWVRQMLDLTEIGIGHRADLLSEAKIRGIDLFDPKYKEEVNKAIEWAKRNARTTPPNTAMMTPSDYQVQIAAIAISGGVTDPRVLPTACSILAAYRRTVEQVVGSGSAWVGKVGDRLQLRVEIQHIFSVPGGTSQYCGKPRTPGNLYKGKDTAGNTVCWFDSVSPPAFTSGEVVTIEGTVKCHQFYRTIRETRLTKVVKV